MTTALQPASAPEKAGLPEVRVYFGYPTLRDFAPDWRALDAESQTAIRVGIANGSYTY